MAITGTGHNGLTTFSLVDGLLTISGPGGAGQVRVGDPTNNYGKILAFDAIREIAIVDDSSPVWGERKREVPLGEVNVTEAAMIRK